MAQLTNDDLMRMADGHVTGAEKERMLEELANDADARARYAAFEATGPALAGPFAKIVNAPVPQHLIDLVMGASAASAIAPGTSAAPSANPEPQPVSREGLLADLFGRFSRLLTPQWAPAVATGLLLAGVGIGALLQSTVANRTSDSASAGPPPAVSIALLGGRPKAGGVLLRTLETAASGETVTAIAGREAPGTAETRLTFKAKTHEFCRQYVIKDHGGQYFAGIACREPGGAWAVREHVQIARRPSAQNKTVPANDPLAVLVPAIEKMMADDALGREEEKAALVKRWQE